MESAAVMLVGKDLKESKMLYTPALGGSSGSPSTIHADNLIFKYPVLHCRPGFLLSTATFSKDCATKQEELGWGGGTLRKGNQIA